MEKKIRLRSLDGKYDFENMSLICKCGHSLACHAGQNETGKRPCFNEDKNIGDGEDCKCKTFRLK